MSRQNWISLGKALLAATLAIALPILSVVHYENVREGLIVGGPPALLLCLFIFSVRYRHVFLFLYLFAAVAGSIPSLQPDYSWRYINGCNLRLKAIGLALESYYADFGTYPPPYSTDVNGNPDKSWRKLILPYVEHSAAPQTLFDCPRLRRRKDPFKGYEATSIAPKTAYVAVVGDHAAWPVGGGRKIADIIDGLGNTILVVEIQGSTIDWNEPRDISLDEVISGYGTMGSDVAGSSHFMRIWALFADGTVKPLPPNLSAADFRRLVTIDDGERFSEDFDF